MTCPASPESSASMQGHDWRWTAQREDVVGEKTCRAVVAL